jgi:metal-dependent hydrolase (beta-lactamase superfamily II)
MDISEQKNIKITGDLLQRLFAEQEKVEKIFAEIEGVPKHLFKGKLENLIHPDVCRHITDNILWRMVQEINEAVVALKNGKTWRQTKYFTDVNEYLDEVADIFIYFMNLCLASGISHKDLAQIVLKKINVNKQRFNSKY